MDTFAQRVRSARVRAGLSQERLAQKLSISKNTVARWESGAVPRADHTMTQLADELGVSLRWLIDGAEDDAPKVAVG